MATAASTSFHHQSNLCRKADTAPPSLYSQRSRVLEMQFDDRGGGKLEETAEVIKQMITDSGIASNTSEARVGCNSSDLPDNPSNTSRATPGDGTTEEESFTTSPESEDGELPQTSSTEVDKGTGMLDSIWTEITGRHGKQPTLKLKKSGTRDMATRRALNKAEPGCEGLRKSETFRGRRKVAVEVVVMKEKSMGQDELRMRIEAFIRKNRDYLRLQREESDLRVDSGITYG